MPTYGLTPAGFVIKPPEVIQSELEQAFQTAFGASINLAPSSNFGQMIGIFRDRLSELWEVAQATDAALDPDSAAGQKLVQLAAITGTVPLAATRSVVTLTLTGTTGTVVAAGKVASVVVTNERFDTLASATLAAATAWAATTAYVAGNRRKNSGNVYVCVIPGTSAGSGGPSGTSLDIVDGTVHWAFLGTGDGFVDVAAQAENTGSVVAVARTCTQIETPVSGWQSVTNLAAAVVGRDAESDAALRTRREAELLGDARATVDSIRTRMLADTPGASNVIVFENTTDATNGDGMPPHSVEVLVQGGVDQVIVDNVFANVAAGIATTGNQTGTHTDLANGGQTYTVHWSRPSGVNIYVIADVTYDQTAGAFPADGAAQITNDILAAGASFAVGQDVTASRLSAAVFGVAGVLDVTSVKIGTAPSPSSSATITITSRQLALFDAARITVNLTPGSP